LIYYFEKIQQLLLCYKDPIPNTPIELLSEHAKHFYKVKSLGTIFVKLFKEQRKLNMFALIVHKNNTLSSGKYRYISLAWGLLLL
jgi:hypothetical protein